MPSPATCRLADNETQIAAQRAVIRRFEHALWEGGFQDALLASYQSAWRRLESLIAAQGVDNRHEFAVIIPVADSPMQLTRCLDSLRAVCEAYGYGGRADGVYRKLRVIVADDTAAADGIAAHQAVVDDFRRHGLAIDYFGLDAQRQLLQRVSGIELERIVGTAQSDIVGHKGQAVMRNIAYLYAATLPPSVAPRIIHTVDADQQFSVPVSGSREGVAAINFFAELDAVFSCTDAEILTGKVVGDPPVSPAVMAATFLDDAMAFVAEMADAKPADAYRQDVTPAPVHDAAYHDMAELFGFAAPAGSHRFRCADLDAPSTATCFAHFAAQLKRFFHGEHPTRCTAYAPDDALASVQPARTVYTGNYAFRASALGGFIPFAPLRLRMSGPTLGRLMKAELGNRFVSANLPMLHGRTLEATAASEYRPGVVSAAERIDLSDEFERQFLGDVMLFTVQRLCADGASMAGLPRERFFEALDAAHADLLQRYGARQQALVAKLDALDAWLRVPTRWWHAPTHATSLAAWRAFIANMRHNFGYAAAGHHAIVAADHWPRWRLRLADALASLEADRRAWRAALARLNDASAPS